jgi:hypothetical protein
MKRSQLPSHIRRPADWTTYDDVIMSINFLVAILVVGVILYDMITNWLLKGYV